MSINSLLIDREFAEIRSTYFNSAYMGPSPLRAKRAAERALGIQTDPSFFSHEQWRPTSDRLREQLAGLLQVPADNIAHSTSVSEIISQVTLGFPFQAGDQVVAMAGDYPSNVLPWMLNEKRIGYELKLLPEECFADPDRLLENLPARTRLLNVSHVMFNTGRRTDLVAVGRILRERGIFFVVDASQSFGGVEISPEELQYIDVMACVTYKWLLGSYGHAFACYADGALKKLERTHASWLASPNSEDTRDLLRYTTEATCGARKFDRGQCPNMVAMDLLSGSLELIDEVGLSEIAAHNRSLVKYFLEGYPHDRYTLITREPLSHIVCLKGQSDDVDSLARRLRIKNIDTSVREGNLRLSFHFFNNIGQVDSLLSAL